MKCCLTAVQWVRKPDSAPGELGAYTVAVNVNMKRAFATSTSALVIAASTTLPALAGGKRDDGDEPGTGMGATHAILLFVLLPIAISGLIALFVLAPGWTKSARAATTGGFLDDPSAREVDGKSPRAQIEH